MYIYIFPPAFHGLILRVTQLKSVDLLKIYRYVNGNRFRLPVLSISLRGPSFLSNTGHVFVK